MAISKIAGILGGIHSQDPLGFAGSGGEHGIDATETLSEEQRRLRSEQIEAFGDEPSPIALEDIDIGEVTVGTEAPTIAAIQGVDTPSLAGLGDIADTRAAQQAGTQKAAATAGSQAASALAGAFCAAGSIAASNGNTEITPAI